MGYRIRREDGEELYAEVRCWERAGTVAAPLRLSTRNWWSPRLRVARY